LAVTDWRLQRWRLWFLALMTATLQSKFFSFFFLFFSPWKRSNRTRSVNDFLAVARKGLDTFKCSFFRILVGDVSSEFFECNHRGANQTKTTFNEEETDRKI